MNGYELVRLQPRQLKRDGDTITGSITAANNAQFLGNASTATTLQTARQINGTNFNGSGNITTANWGTARSIQIGNSAKQVNGGSNVTWTLTDIGAAASNHTHNGGNVNLNGYTKPNQSSAISPNDTINQAIGKLEAGLGNHTHNYAGSNTPGGVATSAHKLQTARNIQVGNTTRAFDGTSNISFSLQDIGASASNHNHDNLYLKLTGGTMSGNILLNANNTISIGTRDKKLNTVYTGVIDFGGTVGLYPTGQYGFAIKCGRQQGGQAGELFYEHNGTTYHFEPKWSGDVPLPESTGLGRSARKWRDVWSHAGSLQTSDITQKENIKKVASEVMLLNADESIEEYSNLSSEAVTSVVQNIQPITFDYKGMRKISEDDGVMDISEDDEAGKVGRQLGISAQELEKLNPTLFEYVGIKTMVENKDGDLVPSYSIKTLAYTNMLLVALQETMKKVELLEKEVVELKSKI